MSGEATGSIWESGEDYDILGESKELRKCGFDWLVQGLETVQNARRPVLVDFGCWSGRHLRLLEDVAVAASSTKFKEQARESVIGIDEPFATERLAEARKANPGFQVFDTGIANTGLGASSVHAAICWRVLHNLTAPGALPAAILEIRRVLRDRAPFIAAVRATPQWMDSSDEAHQAPVPVPYRAYSRSGDRTDLCFSKRACSTFFSFYGFEVESTKEIDEGEIVNGHPLVNRYWMIRMILNKNRGVGEDVGGNFIDHPGDPPRPRTSNDVYIPEA